MDYLTEFDLKQSHIAPNIWMLRVRPAASEEEYEVYPVTTGDLGGLKREIEAAVGGLDAALFVLVNSIGEALMEWRDEAHCWVFPGGKIECDELPPAAAKRECFEEVGVHAELRRLEIPQTRGFHGHPLHVFIARCDDAVRPTEGQKLFWIPLVNSTASDRVYVSAVARAAIAELKGNADAPQ